MDNGATGQVESTEKKPGLIERIIRSKKVSYLFMISLMVYLLMCGYVMFFSGSLFVEAVSKGWYKASASEYDSQSFMLGYLYGFASLLGVLGGIAVLATRAHHYFRHKILLFFPSVIWSTLVVLDIFRWGFLYWTQLLYLVPIMVVCYVVFIGVIKQISIPYLADFSGTGSG